MGLLQLELDCVTTPGVPGAPHAPREQVWPMLERFLADMRAGKSAFYELPKNPAYPREIQQLQNTLASRMPRVETFLHLGIGGSSLGAETIIKALAPMQAPAFHFLDSVDPDALSEILETTNPQTCLLYAVSKSGATLESIAQFVYVYDWLVKKLGATEARKRLVFCTDPGKGALGELAKRWQIPSFHIEPNLGGRYSVLSGVGLFPAMVAGLDYNQFLSGARAVYDHFEEKAAAGEVPEALDLAWRLASLYKGHGRNVTVLMPYSQKLKAFSAWFVQLWAESLGKNGKGLTPVAASGPTDQHSILQLLRDGPQDKVVGFLEVSGFHHVTELKWNEPIGGIFDLVSGITLNQIMDAEFNATRQVLTNASKPHFTVRIPKLTPHTLGQLFYFFELVTALAGYSLGVNPFDQPGVEEGKLLTVERITALRRLQK